MRLRDSRQRIALLAALTAFAATAAIWAVRRGTGPGARRTTWNAVLGCLACNHQFNAELELTFPIRPRTCPKCSKDAAWQMKKCSQCDLAFVPGVSGDPPRPPSMPRCPQCGQDRTVGALVPGLGDLLDDQG